MTHFLDYVAIRSEYLDKYQSFISILVLKSIHKISVFMDQ